MPSRAELRRLPARSDLRMGIALASAITALMILQLGILYFVSAHEAAEQIEDTLEHEIEEVATQLDAGRTPTRLSRTRTAVREIAPDGSARVLYGKWPSRGRLIR